MSSYAFTTAPVVALAATGAVVNQGSAFFYKRDSDWVYLITNWHIVTGRSPYNAQESKTGAIPTKLAIKLHEKLGGGKVNPYRHIDHEITINDHLGQSPIWLEHPDQRFQIDVVAIRIPLTDEWLAKSEFRCLEEEDVEERYQPSPMDDVFIIGYPWGLSSGGGVLPIFKRGSIASLPHIPHDRLPRFLIDSRTTSGMSGSPVIAKHDGTWSPNGVFDDESIIGTVFNFVGVYSGRLESKSSDGEISDIGIVWTKSALDQVLAGNVTGTKLSDL